MDADRVSVEQGNAVESPSHENALKQPKKRFVGKRAAAEAAKPNPGTASIEDGGAIQGIKVQLNCLGLAS